jgi:spore coat protein CotH
MGSKTYNSFNKSSAKFSFILYAATFASGTYDEDEYVKKTNEDDMDWSDIESLFTVLHDETRTTDPATWRTNLEAVFDTDVFLKYLATNTLIQNWDTYGRMTHNYFLYNDPASSKLTWIPWDNNEALQYGKQGGSLPFNFSGLVASEWPLIGYLYADAVYKAKYDGY